MTVAQRGRRRRKRQKRQLASRRARAFAAWCNGRGLDRDILSRYGWPR